jgi:hypothetical protein
MGGTVTIIVKENEQTIHKMARWTNSFPQFIKNPKFFTKDPEHLKDYLKPWQDMMTDYEANKATGQFSHNMTDVYAPQSGLIAPTEYGIIYIDYVAHKIISCQGYSSISNLHMISILMAHDQLRHNLDWQADLDAYQELHRQGRLKIDPKTSRFKNKALAKEVLKLDTSTDLVGDVLKLKAQHKDIFELGVITFKLATRPFEVFDFMDSKANFLKAKKMINELTPLNQAEKQIWAQYLKDRYDE